MGGFVDQESDGVRSAGDAVEGAVQSAVTDLKICLGPSLEAADAHPGWASSGPLAGCTQDWISHLTELINRTAHASDALRAAATAYEEANRRSQAALQEFQWQAN